MSLLKLPQIKADHRLANANFDLRPSALERWEPAIRAASDSETSISIYDAIGADPWTGEGVTAKLVAGVLRKVGSRDVTVNVNSPGGDFFEGVAIYNLLREHQGKVTVKVMGLAASAASVIAMAGDEIQMGEGSFLMIHNAWAVAMGNRNDMRATADILEPFDAAMASLYAERTGMSLTEVTQMMDRETWINSDQAIDLGFANGMIDAIELKKDEDYDRKGGKKAMALVEAAMAKAGYSRSQRRETFKSLFDGTPSAASKPAMPSAGDQDADASEALHSLISALKGKS